MKNTYVFIDFDSTFAQVETLEEIVLVSYKVESEREKVFTEIKRITDLAMEWELSFWEALEERVNLLDINKENIEDVIKSLQAKITPSFERNKEFIRKNKENLYILSGGFKECIVPIAKDFWIDESHVFANDFLYDENGTVTWVNTSNPLSQEWGKAKVVNSLWLNGTKVSIWDGWNDYLLKEAKAVDVFFAFVENVAREKVINKADETLETFDDFIKWAEKK